MRQRGGNVVTAITLYSDLAIYIDNLETNQRDAALNRLIKDAVMTGVYFVNAEVGLLITVGDAIYNSPETQRIMKRNRVRMEQRQGKFQIPSGPLYFEQGKK